jgi:acetoin utilization protein AcuB
MIASDIMTTRPKTIRDTATIQAALDVFWSLEIRHLPVLDDEGALVGMLSDRDVGALVKAFTEGQPTHTKVGDLMSSDVVTVDEDDELEVVIETLLEQRIGAVPVLDGEGALAGIISYVDILRTYAGELAGDMRDAKNIPPKKATAKAKKDAGRRRAKGLAKRIDANGASARG